MWESIEVVIRNIDTANDSVWGEDELPLNSLIVDPLLGILGVLIALLFNQLEFKSVNDISNIEYLFILLHMLNTFWLTLHNKDICIVLFILGNLIVDLVSLVVISSIKQKLWSIALLTVVGSTVTLIDINSFYTALIGVFIVTIIYLSTYILKISNENV